MRETIADWKKDWIDANGLTNELEVIIKDSHRIKSDTSSDEGQTIYEGCFANIPEELLDRKVIECGQILASTNPEREGCYSLII